MSDLVDRLREGVPQREVRWPGNDGSDWITDVSWANDTMLQAANEIKRLQHDLSEARRQAFIEAAEIAASSARDLRNGDAYRFASSHIAAYLRAKAEEV